MCSGDEEVGEGEPPAARFGPFARGPLRRWELAVLVGCASFVLGVLLAAPWDEPPLDWGELQLGTISEWLTFTATTLAACFAAFAARVAFVAYKSQREADAKRDIEISAVATERARADEDRRRAQAELVFAVVQLTHRGPRHWRMTIRVDNTSNQPVYDVLGYWDRRWENVSEVVRTEGVRVLMPGKQTVLVWDLPKNAPGELYGPGRYSAVFRDAGGRYWRREVDGPGLEERDEVEVFDETWVTLAQIEIGDEGANPEA